MNPAWQKEIALSLACAALSAVLFASLSFVFTGSEKNIPLLITVALLAVGWVIVTALTLFSAQHGAAVAAVLMAAAASTILAGGFSWGAAGGGVLLGLAGVGAWHAFKRDQENVRRYRTVDVFRNGTKLLIIGLTLALAGVALPFIEGSIRQDGLQLKPQQVEVILRPLQPLLQEYIPNVSVESNLDDIINSQLRQEGIDPRTISAEQRAGIRQQISQQFKADVTGHESLGELITGRLNTTLQKVTQANPFTVALVAVLLAFLTIRAVIPLITWVLLIAIAGTVWLSRHVGLLRMVRETKEIEILTL